MDPLATPRETSCWLVTHNLNGFGYAKWVKPPFVGRPAHRVIWEFFNGPVPPGMDLHHLCEEKRCRRPDHLLTVTRREHFLLERSRHTFIGRPACKNGHPHTFGEMGKCGECKRLKDRRHYLKNPHAAIERVTAYKKAHRIQIRRADRARYRRRHGGL